MSRPAPRQSTVNRWAKDFPDLKFDGSRLCCESCDQVLALKKSSVLKHVASEHHRNRLSGSVSDFENQRTFNLDLVKMMAGCNIPWSKLNNALFREFAQNCVSGKYKNVSVPAESTLRKNYIAPMCESIKTNISSELQDKYVWIGADETTNTRGEKVAHVLVGAMDENVAMRAHLIASKVIDEANSRTIAALVTTSLNELWGENHEANKEKVLLFTSDATAHMRAAGKVLKRTYFNVVHLTCLARGLHSVAETVRDCYPDVDSLISSVKKVFSKVPETVKLFCDTLPKTALPPEPISTSSGTWIQAASYYYTNFEKVKKVVQQLNAGDAVAISRAQQALMEPQLQEDLAYIHGHFSRIPSVIRSLERRTTAEEFTVVHALNAVFDLRHFIFQLTGTPAERVQCKFQTVLRDNPGFVTLSCVVDLLSRKEVDFSLPNVHVPSLKHFTCFKYAPTTSVDVERSLSAYSWIFDKKRQSFTSEHLEQLLLINFYYSAATNEEFWCP